MSNKQKDTPHQGLVQIYTGEGKGKCVSADTWILTENGLSQITKLVNHYGNPRPNTFNPINLNLATHCGKQEARALYNGGICDTLTAKTRFGYELTGTFNHPVLTLTPKGLRWQSLEELPIGSYVAVSRQAGFFGTTRRKLDDAYMAGLLLGDGHLAAKKRKWTIILTNSEQTIIRFWKEYLKRFDVEVKTYPQRPNDYHINGKDIVQKILSNLWLDPVRSYNKEINHRWLQCNSETLRALLQGLFDTDGSTFGTPPTIDFSSSSEKLARQVHLLLLQFGIIAKYYSQATYHRPNHRLLLRGNEVRLFFERIGFRLERKQQKSADLLSRCNTNVDVIPFTWKLLEKLPLSQKPAMRLSKKGPQPFLKNQFYRQTRYYRERGTNASYTRFKELISHPAVLPSEVKNELERIHNMHVFWDQVIEKKPSRNQVYDFTVPSSHSFVGNGIISHNTTAALGVGLRAAGHGFEVYMIQFMKGQINYGELQAVKYIPNFTIRQFGRPDFVDKSNPDPEDIKLAREALNHARSIIEKKDVNFLILDEVNVAIDFGLITDKEVIALIQSRPSHMELILTGRYAPSSIIEIADLVSEVKEVKHPYQKGVSARKGVEM